MTAPLLEIPFLDPVKAALCLAGEPGFAFLDSAMEHASLGRWSYLAGRPEGRFQVIQGIATWNGTPIGLPAMQALRSRLAAFHQAAIPGGPPFQGGAIGVFSYEAGSLFETLPEQPPSSAQIDFSFYPVVLAIDLLERRAFIAGPRPEGLIELLRRSPQPRPPSPEVGTWADSRNRAEYERDVARVIAAIRAGEIFQANLSHRFNAKPATKPDPLGTYLAVRESNPAPFSALLTDGDRFIACTSPERFLRIDGKKVETRPIKGTKRRDTALEHDAAAAKELAASVKDRAENIMIVDLLRNDLSKVCKSSSVQVPVLCGVESYASVHHLVSMVTGELQEGRDALDLIAGAFPGGSITGAPKIQAMKIIAELEKEPRGVYCGAIGWLGYDGSADLNIAIRTLIYDGVEFSVRAGGGITLLSDPAAEYDETLAKAERLLGAFGKAQLSDMTASDAAA